MFILLRTTKIYGRRKSSLTEEVSGFVAKHSNLDPQAVINIYENNPWVLYHQNMSRIFFFTDRVSLEILRENSQKNWTWQVIEPLSNINNFWQRSFVEALSLHLMIILFKTLLFFNKYLTGFSSSSFSSYPWTSICLTCNRKQRGTRCGLFHPICQTLLWLLRKQTSENNKYHFFQKFISSSSSPKQKLLV